MTQSHSSNLGVLALLGLGAALGYFAACRHQNPRMAVGYHVFNDFDTFPQIIKEIRSTYDGPVKVAVDYMVFNVTKDDIRVRMAVVDEDIWPLPSITEKLAADPSKRVGFSDYIKGGRDVFKDVIDSYYEQTNKEFGTDYKPPK